MLKTYTYSFITYYSVSMYFLYKTKIAFNDKYNPDAVESHLTCHPTLTFLDRQKDQKAK